MALAAIVRLLAVVAIILLSRCQPHAVPEAAAPAPPAPDPRINDPINVSVKSLEVRDGGVVATVLIENTGDSPIEVSRFEMLTIVDTAVVLNKSGPRIVQDPDAYGLLIDPGPPDTDMLSIAEHGHASVELGMAHWKAQSNPVTAATSGEAVMEIGCRLRYRNLIGGANSDCAAHLERAGEGAIQRRSVSSRNTKRG